MTMTMKPMYMVLFREKGLFVVEPVAGMTQSAAIEAALAAKGGYSAGLVEVDMPEGADEVWAAWTEGEGPKGPYFTWRTFDGALSQEEVEAKLQEDGEEWIKLNKSLVYHPANRRITPDEPDVVEFQPE